MGWNQGYAMYEQSVVELYNTGKLYKETLQRILEPYRGTDIDHGGSSNLNTNDGLSADEVVVKILDPELFEKYSVAKDRLLKKMGLKYLNDVFNDYPDDEYNCGEANTLFELLFERWSELLEN